MKNKLFLMVIFIFLWQASSAQEDEMYNFYAGGGLGLQFGTITLIDISPHAAYQISNNLSAGIGLSYQYYRDTRFQEAYSTNIFGGRVFARQDIYNNVFVDGEYEVLSYDSYDWNAGETEQVTAHNILLGGGYRQPIGERAFVNLIILWNLNEDSYSLFNSPISRIEFNFRF